MARLRVENVFEINNAVILISDDDFVVWWYVVRKMPLSTPAEPESERQWVVQLMWRRRRTWRRQIMGTAQYESNVQTNFGSQAMMCARFDSDGGLRVEDRCRWRRWRSMIGVSMMNNRCDGDEFGLLQVAWCLLEHGHKVQRGKLSFCCSELFQMVFSSKHTNSYVKWIELEFRDKIHRPPPSIDSATMMTNAMAMTSATRYYGTTSTILHSALRSSSSFHPHQQYHHQHHTPCVG